MFKKVLLLEKVMNTFLVMYFVNVNVVFMNIYRNSINAFRISTEETCNACFFCLWSDRYRILVSVCISIESIIAQRQYVVCSCWVLYRLTHFTKNRYTDVIFSPLLSVAGLHWWYRISRHHYRQWWPRNVVQKIRGRRIHVPSQRKHQRQLVVYRNKWFAIW